MTPQKLVPSSYISGLIYDLWKIFNIPKSQFLSKIITVLILLACCENTYELLNIETAP